MIHAAISMQRDSGFKLAVELTFDRGVTALYGKSGSGKSTILRLLAGIERGSKADHITITADGDIWQDQKTFVAPHRRNIGYVFQQPQLFPHLCVEDNLTYASRRARTTLVDRAKVLDWLDLASLMSKRPFELSGGEAQRVAIGRALLSGAQYLLLDEPMGSIDQTARARILPYLERLHGELKVPMVYVSHDLTEVNQLADRVYVLEAGSIKAEGSVFETSASLELNKDEGESLAAVLQCTAVGYDEAFDLAVLSISHQRLFVAARRIARGTPLRVRVPARDVSITLRAPEDSSIINVLPVKVDDIASPTGATLLVRLAIEDQFLLARITRKSLAHLNLTQGMNVFAQIKGVALLTDYV